MTWTPDKVEALAKELPKHANLIFVEIDNPVISGSAYKIINDAASALTLALEQKRTAEAERDTYRDMDRQSTERNRELIAERDAANARAEEAAACMQVLVSCARPYLQDGHQHQNREYLLHALDDSVRMIATLRALKEASHG